MKRTNDAQEAAVPLNASSTKKTTAEPIYQQLSEILARNTTLLSYVGKLQFILFEARYSSNLKEGFRFLASFNKHRNNNEETSVAAYTAILKSCYSIDYLNRPGRGPGLSLYNQLLKITARWHTHHWIVSNQEFIQWLKARSLSYPLIFTRLATAEVKINNIKIHFPSLSIKWLVDLAHPLIDTNKFEDNLAAQLIERQHHERLMAFASSLDNAKQLVIQHKLDIWQNMPEIIENQMRSDAADLMQFIDRYKMFFRALVQRDLRESFYAFVATTAASKDFLVQILQDELRLNELLNPTFRDMIIDDNRFVPFIDLLLAGYLSGRLEMLILLAQIGSKAPPEAQSLLNVLTWLGKYHSSVTMILDRRSPFYQWTATSTYHAVIDYFSHTLTDAFPSHAELRRFMDGIDQDVLNYQFLCQNPAIVDFIEKRMPFITPAITAYQQYELDIVNQEIVMPLLPQMAPSAIGQTSPTETAVKSRSPQTNSPVDEHDNVESVISLKMN
ncbi:MAG: hypothetical protein M3R00_00665 [Pseudomonadota bacterium]|nr:hypothetical protein [Pseudomonadota bacterium]